jgi:hypothetical protein
MTPLFFSAEPFVMTKWAMATRRRGHAALASLLGQP